MNESLSLSETAKLLQVTERSIWNYIKKGKLEKVVIDGKTFITTESIEKFSHGKTEPVNESVSLPPGKVLVDLSYLEGMLTRLGQLETEKRYLLEYQADREAKEKELNETKAKLAETEAELNRVKTLSWWRRLFNTK